MIVCMYMLEQIKRKWALQNQKTINDEWLKMLPFIPSIELVWLVWRIVAYIRPLYMVKMQLLLSQQDTM